MIAGKLLLLSLEAARAGQFDDAMELLRTVSNDVNLFDQASRLLNVGAGVPAQVETGQCVQSLASLAKSLSDDSLQVADDAEADDLLPGETVLPTSMSKTLVMNEGNSSPVKLRS